MSKWISGFPPNKNGSYLTRWHNHVTGSPYYYNRIEYISYHNLWCDRHNHLFTAHKFPSVTFEWWDEFKITENKTIRKLKF